MISLTLICDNGHEFSSSFKSTSLFEQMQTAHMLQCPYCASSHIKKGLSRPNVTAKGNTKIETSQKQEPKEAVSATENKELLQELQKMRAYVKQNFENVDDNFAEKARKMHYGEETHKNIYGKMSAEETKDLIEEGVNFNPLPFNLDDN